MSLEPAADLERARTLMPHAQHQCFQPAIEKETGVGIERAAEVIQPMRDPLDP